MSHAPRANTRAPPWLDQFETPAVKQRGNLRARGCRLRRIDFGEHNAGLRPALSENATPRIDNERMAESLSAVFVLAALGSGEDETAVLNRPRTQQHMPMRLAGLPGERRWDGEERRAGLGESAIERRETQVVADRQANPAPRQI